MAKYYSNPINDQYLDELNQAKALFTQVGTGGTSVIREMRSTMDRARGFKNIAFTKPENILNIKDDFIELVEDGGLNTQIIARNIARWGTVVNNIQILIEQAVGGTLNISNLPNIQAIETSPGKFSYNERPQPSRLAGGNLDTISNIKDNQPIDSAYFIQQESKSGLTADQFNKAQAVINTELRDNYDSVFATLDRSISNAKTSIPAYDQNIIEQLRQQAFSRGYSSLYTYLKLFRVEKSVLQDIPRDQLQTINDYTLNYTYNNGIKAVVSIINEKIDYVKSRMLSKPDSIVQEHIDTINQSLKVKLNENVLDGIPYTGSGEEYLTLYPFSYDDLISGRIKENRVTIFQSLGQLVDDSLVKLRNELKIISEYKSNKSLSRASLATPLAPPGYHYMPDGTLMEGDTHSDDTVSSGSIDDPVNFVPHLMYNPKTNEAFMASSYELHLAYEELGYIHSLTQQQPTSFAAADQYGNPIIPDAGGGFLPPETDKEAELTTSVSNVRTTTTSTATYTPTSSGSSGGGGGGGY